MRLVFVQPAMGHRRRGKYLAGWRMEPLSLAVLAGLCPPDTQKLCLDDRIEQLDYDIPADAVLITVETYNARRSYEIAAEYRKRGVPVICGGFHATLNPQEVARHADAVFIGQAESVFAEFLDDLRHRTLKQFYKGCGKNIEWYLPDRGMYRHKRYLPVSLLESGRGCGNICDFCSIQSFFGPTHSRRPLDAVLADLDTLPRKNLKFFVDDNFTAEPDATKELLRAIMPLGIHWVTQMSIHAAHDEELLELMRRSGCAGVLIGFESLRSETLRAMGKAFNTMAGGYAKALGNLRRHHIRVYATFVFGYDSDGPQVFEEVLDFALSQKFYVAAFNHLIPFPGTPLYSRLEREGRLLYPAWWLDQGYSFGMAPFVPSRMSAAELCQKCLELRRRFYSFANILKRANFWNCGDFYAARNFLPINILQKLETDRRFGFPLGNGNLEN